MHSLEGAIIKYFGINPIIVEPGTKTGIRVVTENPRQIGADRIVDAAARMNCMADRYWYLILVLPQLMIWSIKTVHLFPV